MKIIQNLYTKYGVAAKTVEYRQIKIKIASAKALPVSSRHHQSHHQVFQ